MEQEVSEELYHILIDEARTHGMEHYEISNFARPGLRSRHNQLYWSGLPYLGFGPSAHSFDGKVRSWNPSNLKVYIKSTLQGEMIAEKESLSPKEEYHDYLITSLRTSAGADPKLIGDRFEKEIYDHFQKATGTLLERGVMKVREGRVCIDPLSWLLADAILRDLFID